MNLPTVAVAIPWKLHNLPDPATKRWVASKKESVIRAVQTGKVMETDIRKLYAISSEEWREWVDNYTEKGAAGLCVTKQ